MGICQCLANCIVSLALWYGRSGDLGQVWDLSMFSQLYCFSGTVVWAFRRFQTSILFEFVTVSFLNLRGTVDLSFFEKTFLLLPIDTNLVLVTTEVPEFPCRYKLRDIMSVPPPSCSRYKLRHISLLGTSCVTS